MHIEDTLEIFLVTYNRKRHLKNTLQQLFAEDSPIKNCHITILDNKSTDGSSELIEEYRHKFPNITHIIHPRNIGGNGNIARAYELASYKYVWVLCDDDSYNWTNWKEIENAIANNNDIIFLCTEILRNHNSISDLLHQATLIPACIYKTERITDTVLQNMINTTHTMFPQTSLSAEILVNHPGKSFICTKDIVIRGVHNEENPDTPTRGAGEKEDIHPIMRNVFWHIGFLEAIQIVKDKKLRHKIIKEVNFNDRIDKSFFEYLLFILQYNKQNRKNCSYNILTMFSIFNFWQKILLILAIIYFYIVCQIIYIYREPDYIKIRLFNRLKTRLWKRRHAK